MTIEWEDESRLNGFCSLAVGWKEVMDIRPCHVHPVFGVHTLSIVLGHIKLKDVCLTCKINMQFLKCDLHSSNLHPTVVYFDQQRGASYLVYSLSKYAILPFSTFLPHLIRKCWFLSANSNFLTLTHIFSQRWVFAQTERVKV